MTDRYHIGRPLESGPSIRVFEAIEQRRKKRSLVLTLGPWDAASRDGRREFEEFFSQRQALAFPGLVPVLDFAFRGRRLGIISPRIAGRPLFDRPLPFQQALRAGLRITETLRFVHRRGLTLGAPSPAHLFLEPTGDVLLNLSKPYEGVREPAMAYADPGLLDGQRPDLRTDFYWLGMILYRLLTSRRAFAESDGLWLRGKQKLAYPRSPRQVDADIPQEISQLVMSLIQKDERLRPRSLASVLSILRSRTPLTSRGHGRLTAPPCGHVEEVAIGRRVLEDFAERPSSRVLVIEGTPGRGKSGVISQVALTARLLRLEVGESGFKPELDDVKSDDIKPDGFEPSVEPEAESDVEPDAGAVDPGNADAGPAVILHAGGAIDADWLAGLPADGPGSRLVIIERQPEADLSPLLAQSHIPVERIALRPLSPRAMKRLLEGFLGLVGPELVDLLTLSAAGDPFCLRALLEQMADDSELRFSWGAWRWNPSHRQPRAPVALRQRILSRYRRLSRGQRTLLRILALCPPSLRLHDLRELSRLKPSAFEEDLVSLEAGGWLGWSGRLAASRPTLANPWTVRTLRDAIPAGRRRDIHRRLAMALQDRMEPSEADPDKLEELASQWLEARESQRAGDWVAPAAESLTSQGRYRQAADFMLRAWRSGLPAFDNWSFRFRMTQLLYQSGRLSQCLKGADQLLSSRHCRGRQDRQDRTSGQIELLRLMGRAHLLLGETARAQAALARISPLLDPSPSDSAVDNEVEGEMLCCTVYQGDFAKAGQTARRLIGQRHRRSADGYEKICHALALYALFALDRPGQARAWEWRSIRLAFRDQERSRAGGRVLGLALMMAEEGRLGRSRRLIDFVTGDPELNRHGEIQAFALFGNCLLLRLQGRHRQALSGLQKLLSADDSHSRNRDSGALIESARSYNALLLPERALACLKECRRRLKAHFKFDDAIDLALTEAWTLALLGERQRCEETLSTIEWTRIRRKRVRLHLLHARIHLLRQRPRHALFEVRRVRKRSREARPGIDLEMDLLQAEALLCLDEPLAARPLLRRARRAAERESLWPEMTQTMILLAKMQRRLGRVGPARLFLGRARRWASASQSPLLEARVLEEEAHLAVLQGQTDRACAAFSKALLILKERLLHLSQRHRRDFDHHLIQPLEEEHRRLSSGPSSQRYLAQLRRFLSASGGAVGRHDLGRLFLKTLESCLPIRGNLYLRLAADADFELVASAGRSHRTGRRLLSQLDSAATSHLDIEVFQGAPRPLAIRFQRQGSFSGLLYLEVERASLSEAAVDFLLCMCGGLENGLGRMSSRPVQPVRTVVEAESDLGIIGRDPALLEVLDQLKRIARARTGVLIAGESGTGKELFARALHKLSPRRSRPFVAVNCLGLAETLVEAELFGFAKGSFSGAHRDKPGLFEAAQGGTLFLDEIAGMPQGLQQSLLRALQERRIRRLGETRERSVDIRLISASNQPLDHLVEEGSFRRDLYHRLDVCRLEIPPLRGRRGDIPLLCRYFLDRLYRRQGHPVELTDEALELLLAYRFPGNIRELENLLESAYFLCRDRRIRRSDLAGRMESRAGGPADDDRAQKFLEALACGRENFWTAVRDPFLARDLSRNEVREIISLGLARCHGRYSDLLEYFNLADSDYKKFLGFLSNHGCKVDFRPFRRRR